jgi:predicted DNA repair protein MutK
MFLVGGGILTHGVPAAHALLEQLEQSVHAVPVVGGVLAALLPMLLDALVGVLAGAALLLAWTAVRRMVRSNAKT